MIVISCYFAPKWMISRRLSNMIFVSYAFNFIIILISYYKVDVKKLFDIIELHVTGSSNNVNTGCSDNDNKLEPSSPIDKHFSRCNSTGSVHTPSSSAHNTGKFVLIMILEN